MSESNKAEPVLWKKRQSSPAACGSQRIGASESVDFFHTYKVLLTLSYAPT